MESCKRNVGEIERLGCLAVGIWMLLRGILSRRTSRTVLGGLLIYRGMSGCCKGYEVLGIDTRSTAEKAQD
jgi:hypothetical protein